MYLRRRYVRTYLRHKIFKGGFFKLFVVVVVVVVVVAIVVVVAFNAGIKLSSRYKTF